MTLSILVLCLALAAMLRFPALDLMEYKIDESKTLKQVSEVVDKGVFLTRAEISSKGMPHPPLNVYLILPVWAASRDPLVVTWVIALLNVATVGLTYWMGQRYFSPRAGLIAAALLAVSPWAVMFSRKIWRGDMMPFFGALLIVAALRLIVERRKRAIFWVCLWAAVAAQLHQTGYPVAFAVLVCLIIYRPPISRRALALGLASVALLYSPYIIFAVNGGWRMLQDFFMGRAPCRACTPPSSLLQQLEPIWHLANVGNFSFLIGETSYYLDAKLGAWGAVLNPIAALEQLGIIAGFGWLAWRLLRPGKDPHIRPVGAVLGLSTISLVAICLLAAWRCLPQYYTIILVIPFLLLGAATDRGLAYLGSHSVPGWVSRASSGLVVSLLAGAVLTQVYFTTTLLSLIDANGGASGEYGVSYRHKDSLAAYLAQNYGPGCYRIRHDWESLYYLGVRYYELEGLVKQRSEKRPCPEGGPEELYVLEVLDRPLSPEAEASLRPYRRFGSIYVYTDSVESAR